MLVPDEHVQPLDPDLSPELPAMVWMANITDETRPIPVSCFQLPELVGIKAPLMTACHQPAETIGGNEAPAAWFANGPRVIDISDPLSMKQAAWWMPDVPAGMSRVCSNDVYVDRSCLIYLIDRNRGSVDPGARPVPLHKGFDGLKGGLHSTQGGPSSAAARSTKFWPKAEWRV